MKLSIIIPFCNEWPQVVWTIKNLAEELRDRVDFEIIAINNFVDEVKNQGHPEDRGYEYLLNFMKKNSWLKVLWYKDKLSHWCAKNLGVVNSTGNILFFSDAHCVISRDALYNMFSLYEFSNKMMEGSIHLPLTYHILETSKLIYKPIVSREHGALGYSFAPYIEAKEPYEVACMSTCGMMITRKIFDTIGGWPNELGVYGGGENFINYVFGLYGFKKYIMPGGALHHHGDKRGYNMGYIPVFRNKAIAMYLVGGEEWMNKYINAMEGKNRNPLQIELVEKIRREIVELHKKQREHILSVSKCSLDEFLVKWNL